MTIWSRASFSVSSNWYIVTRLNIIQDNKCYCCVNSLAVCWRPFQSIFRRHQWCLDLIWDNFAITLFSCQRWPWNIEGCLVQSTERHIIWCYTGFWQKGIKNNTNSDKWSAVCHWTKNLINNYFWITFDQKFILKVYLNCISVILSSFPLHHIFIFFRYVVIHVEYNHVHQSFKNTCILDRTWSW